MHDWVNNNYPGTKLAITEYNWGALEDINGALAQADVLGIFGREGVDLATIWAPPAPDQPGAFAFRMYRSYDGMGGAFGETSVQAASAAQDQLSVYAARRSDSALTVMVVNKTTGDLTTNLSLANFKPAARAQVWTYSPKNLKAIVRGMDLPVSASGLKTTFPAYSITLLVVPADPATLAAPLPVIDSITNGATNAAALSPGAIVSISGRGLDPAIIADGAVSSSGMIQSSAGGTRVLFDGTPAPVLFTSADRVGAVVPYVAALAPVTHVQVEYLGSRSAPVEIPVSAVAPGVFSVDTSGAGQAAVINEDGSLNSADHPAARGSIVTVFCTGEGQTSPPGVDGKIADQILPRPLFPVSVKIGRASVTPLYAAAAGGAVAGALQVNVEIPASVTPGSHVPIQIQISMASSQPNVTIAVK